MSKNTTRAETFKNTRKATAFVGMNRDTFVRPVLPHVPHRLAGNRYLISKKVLRDWLEGKTP